MTAAALFVALAAAQEVNDTKNAQELLTKVVEKFRQTKDLHYTVHRVSELKGRLHDSRSTSTMTYARDAAGRLRYEVDETALTFIAVWDGKTIWRGSGNTMEYSKEASTESPLNLKNRGDLADNAMARARVTPKSFDMMTEGVLHAERLPPETLTPMEGGSPVRCDVIRATYQRPPGTRGIESFVRTYWIDPERLLLLKEDSRSRGKIYPAKPFEDGENHHIATYTWTSAGVTPADSVFTWQPPAEYKEVDKLVSAYARPPVDMTGKPAPEFSLKPVDGSAPVTLSSLRGKTVLLDFWATWCEPCRAQMPAIAKLAADGKDKGLVVIGISSDESVETARKYLNDHNYTWLNLFDGKERKANDTFNISGIPTVILIDREGIVRKIEMGSNDAADKSIREAIRGQGILMP